MASPMSAGLDAAGLARALLASHLPARWRHVQGVAAEAQRLGDHLGQIDRDALVRAAWLHDIGYSPEVSVSGFHPLDGARFLAKRDTDAHVVALVANHSGAAIEACLRGINGMRAYPDTVTATRDALWYCDAITGPSGERLSPSERWAEVRQRYGPHHVVTLFLDRAEPLMRAAVERTEQRILAAGLSQST